MQNIFLIVILLFLSGCGKYQLISFDSNRLPEELEWKVEKKLRLPNNWTEEFAARVAANHQTLADGNKLFVYLGGDEKDTLVAAVESMKGDSSSDNEMFAPKKVRRYVIQSGQIHASMGPSIEPFPDELLERVIIKTAMTALHEGGWGIIVVSNWREPVILKGTSRGGCSVEVTGYKTGTDGPGDELFTKTVNCCRP